MPNLQDITLAVPDVSCEHCVAAINGALLQQPGVQSVQVDVENKTVRFTYEPEQVSLATLQGVLDDAGYPVAR